MKSLLGMMAELAFVGPKMCIEAVEMSVSAILVISSRVKILGSFSHRPNTHAIHESYRMVTEKYLGAIESSVGAAQAIFDVIDERSKNTRQKSSQIKKRNSLNPFAWPWRFFTGSMRFYIWLLNMGIKNTRDVWGVYEGAISPLHKRVVSNAKRLRRK